MLFEFQPYIKNRLEVWQIFLAKGIFKISLVIFLLEKTFFILYFITKIEGASMSNTKTSYEQLSAPMMVLDDQMLEELYKNHFFYCTNFILKNNGSPEDAKEIFQEALIILYKNFKKEGFSIQSNLRSYLYGVCRNLWLKKLAKQQKSGLKLTLDEPNQNFEEIVAENEVEEKSEKERLYELLEQTIKNLSEECKKLIKLFFYEKLTYKEVAKKVDYKESYIRKKKKSCIDKIKVGVKLKMGTI